MAAKNQTKNTTKKTVAKAPAKKTKPATKPKAAPKPVAKKATAAKPTEKATNKAILYNGKPRIISVIVQGGQALVVDATTGRKQYVADAPNGVEVTVKVC